MVNAPISNRAIHSTNMQGMLGNDVNAPGTGEGGFDFLNYLLGLQVAPTDVATDLNVLSLKTGEQTQTQDEPILSLFDKKGSELVNPMIVGTPQITDNKAAKPTIIPGSEILGETKTGDVKEDRSIQKTTSLYDFEKRMLLESSAKPAEQQTEKVTELGKQQKVETLTGEKNIDPGYEKMQKVTLKTQGEQIKTDSKEPSKSQVDFKDNKENITNVIHHSAFTKETADTAGTEKKRSKDEELDLFSASMDTSAPVPQGIQADTGVDKHKPMQKPASVPEMFSRVESMVHNGGGKMTITLNPPSLGHVEVQVTTKGKNVEIQMKSSNDFAKAAIESHVAELKTSMQSQDLVLQKMDVHVNHDLGKNFAGGQFAQQQSGNPYQQNQSGFREFQNGSKSSFGNENQTRSVTQAPTRTEWKPATYVSGRVDIRV